MPVMGFGGFETIRGISFGRWHAPGKAIVNAEARFYVLSHTIFKRPMVWQIALLADAGIVWGAGDDATAGAAELPLHPAGGLGIRVIFEETFVGRIDAGVGVDPVTEEDGSITHEPTFGIYFMFDHAF